MSFPRYERYKDSGVEWLGEVPEHWAVTRLKFVATVQTGVAKGKDYSGKQTVEVPYLRVANVQDGYLDLEEIATIEIPAEDVQRYCLAVGDVLMNEGGDFDKLGRGHVWRGEIDPCIHQNHVFAVRPHTISSEWLNAVTGSAYAQFYFMTRSKQSTNLASISSTNIMDLPVVLPPIDEQSTIRTFLDRETSKIDELVAEQERLIALLKEKRQAAISHAVTKGLNPDAPMKDSGVEWLGEVPVGWEIKKLKHLVSTENGEGIKIGPFGGMLTDLIYEDEGLFKVYGQENILSGDFTKGIRWIDRDKFNSLSTYHLFKDDILFTRKGSIGGCCIVPQDIQPGIIDSDTIRMRVAKELLSTEFILYAFKYAFYLQVQVQEVKRGAILSGLNTSTVENLTFIMPPLPEQHAITCFLGNETTKIDNLVAEAQQAITLLKERRTALISAAVTGKIDVRGLA